MKLSEVKVGGKAVIVKVAGHGCFRKRRVEMGFIKGKMVEVINKAPLGDPIEYRIMGYNVSLRLNEAQHIEVISVEEAEEIAKQNTHDKLNIISEDEIRSVALQKRKDIQVALVGNPNAGKTSLFNVISGAKRRWETIRELLLMQKLMFLNIKDIIFLWLIFLELILFLPILLKKDMCVSKLQKSIRISLSM